MTKKISGHRAKITPTSQVRAEDRSKQLLEEMASHKLHEARLLAKNELAEKLHVQYPTIAKLEKRADIYLSTLRSHIESMDGQLEIIARFPEISIRINNFSDL
jgi:hypothetical protein